MLLKSNFIGRICRIFDKIGSFEKFAGRVEGEKRTKLDVTPCTCTEVGRLAGGPHYVGFPAAHPSYLFNVSFALVTIQIGPSLFTRCLPPSPSISLVFSLIIWKPMFNNAAFTCSICYL